MTVYIKVITLSSEHCAACKRDLPKGYHGFVPLSVHYEERIKALDTVICLECKNKELI